ncbi:MAG: LTA synthase family protein [Oscillospiraceae bacterium]|nr:LTA synthase family protein [Oscillospiraceae bacterium]
MSANEKGQHIPWYARYPHAVRQNPLFYKLLCVLLAAGLPFGLLWYLGIYIKDTTPDTEFWLWFTLLFPPAFFSILLSMLPLKPFYRSVYWLHRILLFLIVGTAQLAVQLLLPGGDTLSWYLCWLIPPAVTLILHFVIAGGKKASENGNRFFRRIADTALLLFPHFGRKKDAQKKPMIVRGILFGLLSLLAVFAAGGAIFLTGRFQNMGVQSLSFTVKFSEGNGNPDLNLIIGLIVGGLVLVLLLGSIFAIRYSSAETVTARSLDGSEKRSVPARKGIIRIWSLFLLAVTVCGFWHAGEVLHVFHYMKYLTADDSFYEKYYVSPENDLLTFPEKKKNLIFMFVESMENTFADRDNGGNYSFNYIPELLEIEREGINFSHTTGLGGASVFYDNVSYTMGSTVAHTSGTPLFSLRSLSPDTFTASLPGLRRLEDVLHDAGYFQFYMEGSDKKFARYDTYVGRYGDSVIYDSEDARNEGYLTDENKSFWGLPDYALLEAAKDKLTMLSQSDKPFFFSIYTIDTHGVEGGYRCKYCDPAIENDYAASVRCASIHVADFVRWIQQQDFYKDTVIVMVGDHTAEVVMDHSFIKPDHSGVNHNGSYTRNTYNCILNSDVEPYNPKNRIFSANDMFPTTLAAIGVEIEGNRLGLGTNLFSNRATLCEELGIPEYLDKITVSSDYYYRHFWHQE